MTGAIKQGWPPVPSPYDFKADKRNRRVELQIRNLPGLTTRGIRQGFFRLGAALKQNMNAEVLKKDKTGRIYIKRDRAGRRRRHRASAPGQTPANRTGTYRRGIGYQIHGSDMLQFGIREEVPYAGFLENGTRKMKPRPGVGNTVKSMQGQAHEYFTGSLESGLTKK